MDTVYQMMEALLPFGFIEYDFMKRALLAVLLITPLFGMLGTMTLYNKMAYFSDALGHSAFTGIALGVVLGVENTGIAMSLFAVVFALGLNHIRYKNTSSTDTLISVFASLGTAIGLVLLSYGGNFSAYSSLLVGDILNIDHREIVILMLLLMATFLFYVLVFNKLHAVSINSSLARSKGIPVRLVDSAFVVLMALIVMAAVRWVGILIINALLILPAAAARNFSANMREYHLFTILISVFCGVLGLILSFYLDTAAGPTIVIIAALMFFISLGMRMR